MKGTYLVLFVSLVLILIAGAYVSTIPAQAMPALPLWDSAQSVLAAPRTSTSIRYVNPSTGTDGTNNCLSLSSPCLTIQHAVDEAVGTSVTVSDTVQLAEGTYSGNVSIPAKKYVIIQGNATKQATTVVNGTITMGGSQLGLNNVTVTGSGTSGGGLFISTPATTTVFVRNSIFLNNTATNGGAIYNNGDLTVLRSTFQGNSATGAGAAIFNATSATAVISQTAVVTNTGGGGIANAGALTVINSTFGNNTGDGIASTGGSLSLNNVTVADNTAIGVHITGGTSSIQNSIMASNTTADCSGTSSGGYNILTVAGCGFSGGTNQITDPLLTALALNHGPNMNYLPQSTSPAVDKGNPAGCTDGQGNVLTSDQRGELRPQNGGIALVCDIGAVEFGDAPILATISPDTVAAGSGDFSMTLTGSWHQTNAVVLWTSPGGGTSTLTPSSRTGTQMVVTIPAFMVSLGGTAYVAVQNPGVGPGSLPSNSAALPFNITGTGQALLLLPFVVR